MHKYIDCGIADKDDRIFHCSYEACRKRKYFLNMPTVTTEEFRQPLTHTKPFFSTEIKATDFKDVGVELDDL